MEDILRVLNDHIRFQEMLLANLRDEKAKLEDALTKAATNIAALTAENNHLLALLEDTK